MSTFLEENGVCSGCLKLRGIGPVSTQFEGPTWGQLYAIQFKGSPGYTHSTVNHSKNFVDEEDPYPKYGGDVESGEASQQGALLNASFDAQRLPMRVHV